MQAFLFGAYQFLSIVLYLFLSAVLVYHRLVGRWLKFSCVFFFVYAAGSYLFFGIWPLPFPTREAFEASPYYLFFFGSAACVGFALGRELSFRQTAGLLVLYLFAVATMVFLLEAALGVDLMLPGKGMIEKFILALPYIGFYIGVPIVFGYCMYKGMGIFQAVGLLLVFGFSLVLVIAATTNYFGKPFGFFYELQPHARAWIEVGSVLALVLGVFGVIGFSLLNGMTEEQTNGAFLVFLALMGLVMALVHLTIGYEFIWDIIKGRRELFPGVRP